MEVTGEPFPGEGHLLRLGLRARDVPVRLDHWVPTRFPQGFFMMYTLLPQTLKVDMGVSENRGPQYSTVHSTGRILMIRTPK